MSSGTLRIQVHMYLYVIASIVHMYTYFCMFSSVHVYIPLQEEVHASSVAEPSPSDSQVLHEAKVLDLVAHYLLLKPTWWQTHRHSKLMHVLFNPHPHLLELRVHVHVYTRI